jgi:glycosyltransferase involved in cell wall biosynthesis
MRVAAYTGGVMVPSARARVRQYIEPLGGLGITVREYPLPLGNILPAQPALRPLWMATTAAARVADLALSWKADVTWISRQLLPAFTPLHRMAKQPIILDVDDAVWLNTGGHRAGNLARASQMVVCGNNFLANHFSHWNTNTIVIPTAVNTSWYRPHLSASEDDLIMGWTGTSGNFPFLYAIEEALIKVFQSSGRAKLLVVADRPPRFRLLPESRVEFQRWTPRTELAAFARMSIGLMPLADNDWCNGKCSYKMLCYMSAGLPVVVTAAGMNREVLAMGEVGISAGSEREWVEALATLLQDAALRRRMGATGRKVIEQHFSLQLLAQRYALLFQTLDPKLQGSTSPVLFRRAIEKESPTEGKSQRHSLIPCPAQ